VENSTEGSTAPSFSRRKSIVSVPASTSQTTPPVVCAGLVVADHVSPPLDHLPRPGELISVDDLVLNIGGGAANTAVDLARLGVRSAICARVGDDIFGRFASETLRRRGVDCTALKVDPTQSTSQTLIVNVRGEDRRFIHAGGANGGFVAEDLDAALAWCPRVLHIGYFLILPNLDAHALAARFKRARAGGTLTLLDVATPGPGQYLDRLRVVLPETDIFVPNTDEAALILGERDPVRQARAFRELGARRVVITLGERGVISLSDDLEVRLAVYPIPFVDGSGGGDAFNAGYVLGLLDGRPELECLKLASAVGASCVRAVGTTAGVFTREEAEAFMRGHELGVEPLN
jgi:sugar/nucleoside kinase (ribokinase family)